MTPSTDAEGTLGALVQDYVAVQCRVILESRLRLEQRDEDAVHPARVAIRRLRATLHTFAAVYRRVDREAFAQELAWLGQLLGEVRDLQVLAERFAADERVPTVVDDVLATVFARRRRDAWAAAVTGTTSVRGVAVFAVVQRWLSDPPARRAAGRDADAAHALVDEARAEASRRLRRARKARTDTRVHAARKAVKRHRYAVELARPVLGAGVQTTIAEREALQDALGAHQDAVVAAAFLRSIDTAAMDPHTVEAVRALVRRMEHTAADLDGIWAQLD